MFNPGMNEASVALGVKNIFIKLSLLLFIFYYNSVQNFCKIYFVDRHELMNHCGINNVSM